MLAAPPRYQPSIYFTARTSFSTLIYHLNNEQNRLAGELPYLDSDLVNARKRPLPARNAVRNLFTVVEIL